MENAIVALFCIALFLVGTLNLTMTSFTLLDDISSSWRQSEDRRYDIRQTEIATADATVQQEGSQVKITVSNEGAVSLGNFDRWDVITRYQDGTVMWLPYGTSTPGWTVGGIYFGGESEVFEPDILNPGEEMQLILKLDPPLSEDSAGEVSISTPGGIIARAMFARE